MSNISNKYTIINMYKNILLMMTVIVVFLCFPLSIKAENAKEEIPTIDENRRVSISINLDDNSRFMGISLYRIADYKNNRFEYLDSYNKLDIPKYYKLSREADKKAAASVISKYIKENNIQPDYDVKLTGGKASISDLGIGVYLIMQNDNDENATLKDFILVEAPKLIDEEYQYDFILKPKYTKKIWFAFRPEVVYPITIVIGMLIGLIMCIFGAKVFRSSFMLACFILMGLVGMHLGRRINASFLALLVFFILFAFIGLALVMFLDAAFIAPFRKTKAAPKAQRAGNYLTAIIGAALFSTLLYFFVLPQIMITSIVFAGLGISGLIIQYLRRDKYIIFYTYEDLIATELKTVEPIVLAEPILLPDSKVGETAEGIISGVMETETVSDICDDEIIENSEIDKVELLETEPVITEEEPKKESEIDPEPETESESEPKPDPEPEPLPLKDNNVEKKPIVIKDNKKLPAAKMSKNNIKYVAYFVVAAACIGIIIKVLNKEDKQRDS